jgi:hypothetical protein
LPREAGDIADACASVPSSSGYRSTLQTLFRGKMSGAAIALVLRQVVIMALSVGSSVAVSRWLGPEVVGRFAILIFVTQGILVEMEITVKVASNVIFNRSGTLLRGRVSRIRFDGLVLSATLFRFCLLALCSCAPRIWNPWAV